MNLDAQARRSAPRQPGRGRGQRLRLAVIAACSLLVALALAAPASAALPSFVSEFDGVDTPDRSMAPTRLAVNERSGDVYVIDIANDVVNVFSSSGAYVSQITPADLTARTFNFGVGEDDIAIDNSGGPNDGNVYVNSEAASLGGPANPSLFAFDSDGRFLWEISGFFDLCGIAVDSGGNPWALDYAAGIQQLDPSDGSRVGSPLGAGGAPTGGNECHFDFDASGDVLLTHYLAGVDKYARDGTLIANLDGGSISDVAVDRSTDTVYTDRGGSVGVYDAANSFQGEFGLAQISGSFGTAVNGATGQIYVGQSGGRVAIYQATVSRALDVTVDGTGGGRVDADVGAIAGCTRSGGVCSDSQDDGTTVTLTATPDAGSAVRWSGCTSAIGSQCIVSLTRDVTVTATFDLIPTHTLEVVKDGTGGGSVGSVPGGISCGATCDALFEEGTEVTLTATADATSTFAGWSGGGCSGTGTCRVTVGANTTVTATFDQNAPSATTGAASSVTQTSATVSGTVNPNGAETTCTFEYGTTTAYGSSAPCSPAPGAGTSGVAVSAALSGLAAGTTYHYRVVTRNAGGTTNGADMTFTTETAPVPPPRTCETDPSLCPPPPPVDEGVLELDKRLAMVAGGKAAVQLSCAGDTACAGKVRLVAKVRVGGKKGKGKRKARKSRTKNVLVGRASVDISGGESQTVKVRLTRTGKRLLARAKRGRLVATLVGPDLRERVVLKEKATKKSKRKKGKRARRKARS